MRRACRGGLEGLDVLTPPPFSHDRSNWLLNKAFNRDFSTVAPLVLVNLLLDGTQYPDNVSLWEEGFVLALGLGEAVHHGCGRSWRLLVTLYPHSGSRKK